MIACLQNAVSVLVLIGPGGLKTCCGPNEAISSGYPREQETLMSLDVVVDGSRKRRAPSR